MKIYFFFLFIGFIQLKIQFEWTDDTLARRPSDLVYENHYQGQNFPTLGEFSKNAFAIVNLAAPSDLLVTNQMLNVNVNAKINNEIKEESADCICNAAIGNGFLLCDFKNINKEIDFIQILDNKENDDIEFDLKDYNTWVEICNGIYGDDNNNNNNNNNNDNNTISNNDNKNKDNLSKGAIAGITISSIVVASGIAYFIYKMISKNKGEISNKNNQNIIKERSENININEKNMESTNKTEDEVNEFPKNINQDNAKKVLEYLKSKVGCGYAFGTEGETLTSSLLDDLKNKYNNHVIDSTKNWLGKECYDCSGLVMKALDQVGIKVNHNAESIWQKDLKERGDIKDIPKDKLCLVFRKNKVSCKMEHIGVYLGNGKVIEAKGANYGVKESEFGSNWTNWGIPSGLE